MLLYCWLLFCIMVYLFFRNKDEKRKYAKSEHISWTEKKDGKTYHYWKYRHAGDRHFREFLITEEDENGNLKTIVET